MGYGLWGYGDLGCGVMRLWGCEVMGMILVL